MDIPEPLQWTLIFICLIGSFLFSASENAFSCCNRFHFKVKAQEGKFYGKLVSYIINKYDDFLIAGLIGNNLMAVVISSISTILFLDLLSKYIPSPDTISIISTVVMTFIVFEFGDMLPKFISKAIPNRMAIFLSFIIFFFYIIFYPIVLFFKGLLYLLKKLFRIKDEAKITTEEFQEAANEVTINGILEKEENKILNKTFYFDKISVNQVLTKKEDIVEINIKNLTIDKVNKIILNTKFSRIPIYENNSDNIVGILTVREYFKEYMKDNHLNIASILQEPYFVNQNSKIEDIFKGFNEQKTHIAIVKNDENKVIGMITMEDILEELVGDIDENKINLLDKNMEGR